MEELFWVYGCYPYISEKQYRWKCKKFTSSEDATNFITMSKEQPPLIYIPKYKPDFMHKYDITKNIQSFTKIDIN